MPTTSSYISPNSNQLHITYQLNNLHMCVFDINYWIAKHFLQLNTNKSEITVFKNHLT